MVVSAEGLRALSMEQLQARVAETSLPNVLANALFSAVLCVTPYKETASDLMAFWGKDLVKEGNAVQEVHKLLTDAEALRRRVARSLNEFWEKRDSMFTVAKDNVPDDVLLQRVKAVDDWATHGDQQYEWLKQPRELMYEMVKRAHPQLKKDIDIRNGPYSALSHLLVGMLRFNNHGVVIGTDGGFPIYQLVPILREMQARPSTRQMRELTEIDHLIDEDDIISVWYADTSSKARMHVERVWRLSKEDWSRMKKMNTLGRWLAVNDASDISRIRCHSGHGANTAVVLDKMVEGHFAGKVTLFHATRSDVAESIITNGLRPGGMATGVNNRATVFFTTDEPTSERGIATTRTGSDIVVMCNSHELIERDIPLFSAHRANTIVTPMVVPPDLITAIYKYEGRQKIITYVRDPKVGAETSAPPKVPAAVPAKVAAKVAEKSAPAGAPPKPVLVKAKPGKAAAETSAPPPVPPDTMTSPLTGRPVVPAPGAVAAVVQQFEAKTSSHSKSRPSTPTPAARPKDSVPLVKPAPESAETSATSAVSSPGVPLETSEAAPTVGASVPSDKDVEMAHIRCGGRPHDWGRRRRR